MTNSKRRVNADFPLIKKKDVSIVFKNAFSLYDLGNLFLLEFFDGISR